MSDILYCESLPSLSSISPDRSIEKGSCEDHQYCDFQAFRLLVTSPVAALPVCKPCLYVFVCTSVQTGPSNQIHQRRSLSILGTIPGPFEPRPPRSRDRTPRGSPVTLEYVWPDGEIGFIVVIIISPFKPADTGSLIGQY